ncbi:MAG: AraC family transcriptional regulator [Chitinophagaceae bacterium]
MKILQFTIPVQQDRNIIARIDVLPYFYPYLHRHKEIQITWVQQGDGTLVVNNNMHVFQPNDIFFIGANQPHIFKSGASYFSQKSNKKIVSLDIFIDPEILCNTLLNISELKPLKSFISLSQNGFKVPDEYLASVSNKMLLVKGAETGVQRSLYFIELLQLLSAIENTAKLSTQAPIVNNEAEGIRISKIYNYILQNFGKEITLEEVAKEAYMTPHAFCRYFKKHTRHTFVSFLNEVRINEACKLFSSGEYDSIATIAYNCGFNSITNFNRVFKTTTGQSPSAYITNLKNSVELQEPGHFIFPN